MKATQPKPWDKVQVWEAVILYAYQKGQMVSAGGPSDFGSCIKETEERGLNAIYGNKSCDAVFYVRFWGPTDGRSTAAFFGMFDFNRIRDSAPVSAEAYKAMRLKEKELQEKLEPKTPPIKL